MRETEQKELSYATPMARPASPLLAATVLAAIGLALVVLGGCFLIPVASPLLDPKGALAMPASAFPIAALLILIALACLSLAASLLLIAVRRLIDLMHGS